jgi:hypothetical protein
MYNYYTQMYEPYRYVKQHKSVLRTSQRNLKLLCKNIYDGRPDTTDSADAPPVNSREFEDAIGGLKYDIRQPTEIRRSG